MPLVLLAVERDRRDALAAGVCGLALVEDHDADGTGGGGVLCLDLERAAAPLEQGDVPGGEAGEVPGLAAAGRGVAEAELEVDGGDRGGHVTGVGLVDHPEVDVLDVGDRLRRRLLQRRCTEGREREVVEGLDHGVVAGGLEPVDHVVDRGVVAGQAREAVPAVGVGDRLERGLVLAHARERDAFEELGGRVVVAALTGRRPGLCGAGVQRHHQGQHECGHSGSYELGHLIPPCRCAPSGRSTPWREAGP